MKQAPELNDKQVKKLFNSPKMTKYETRNRLILSLSYFAGNRAIEIPAYVSAMSSMVMVLSRIQSSLNLIRLRVMNHKQWCYQHI